MVDSEQAKTKTTRRSSGRPRRTREEFSGWDCSVCTFKNPPEAFKCSMCDTRKGTSTRKPRTSQQQIVIHQASQQISKKERRGRRPNRPARLKNVDRSNAEHTVVTVGDVTVIITDYKPKREAHLSDHDDTFSQTTTETDSE